MSSEQSYHSHNAHTRTEFPISQESPNSPPSTSTRAAGRSSSAQHLIRRKPVRSMSTATAHSTHSTTNNSVISRLEYTGDDRSELPIEEIPPPPFGADLGRLDFNQNDFDTKANVSNDGRLNINIDQRSRQFADLLAPVLRSQQDAQHIEPSPRALQTPHSLHDQAKAPPPPVLNVVIQVVGSRGDVQPFVALGKVLKEIYGHRVRLATHGTFKKFVEDNGLEFFSIGGDPAELMAFMVKNPGLLPGMDSIKSGEIGKRRKGMYEIFIGCWRSCIETGDGMAATSSNNGDDIVRPFIANAIIANPPSFAHIHCAEKLGIPLHLMFTMPWSATQAFPHPLANVEASNADTTVTNFVSYALVEMMTWQGLGDLVNRFRRKSLGLERVSVVWAPGMATRLKIPYTYCWSPALIPKPDDWGAHIDVSGFYFLSLASSFTPGLDLQAFLNAGPPPVYIGFGSIVVDDPNGMTKLIFEAVKKSGQRALVSKGWGGFGADDIPDGIFMLGNVPHDWLFKRVSCVVHHGGAGTMAAGIALGKPTCIVPFFGDQPFWGAMIARAGAGPLPIPNKELTADKLAAGIAKCLEPNTLRRAQELGAKIGFEKGTTAGAESFHDKLEVDSLRCDIAPTYVAVWRVKRTSIKLSAFAVATLLEEGLLNANDLKLYRPREYDSEEAPWDPISGILGALMGTTGSLMMGVADYPAGMFNGLRTKSSGQDQAKKSNQKAEGSIPGHSNTNASRTQDDGRDRLAPGDGPLTPSNSTERRRSSNPSKSFSQHLNTVGTQAGQASLGTATGIGKGTGKIMGVALKMPMDFTLGMAKGFRNAPKLYGDDTVREADKITGVGSGLKTAGKEFGLGLYDGITGLVTQPVKGAQKEGVVGALKGFGKGIGGIVLKPSAAACGVPGYTFKGIYKGLQNMRGADVQDSIAAAHAAQGLEDWKRSSPEERAEVVRRWRSR